MPRQLFTENFGNDAVWLEENIPLLEISDPQIHQILKSLSDIPLVKLLIFQASRVVLLLRFFRVLYDVAALKQDALQHAAPLRFAP